MSIKNLFTKGTTFQSATSGSSTVESFDFIQTKAEQNSTFQPNIDFATASNFAKYGSAYEYYTQTIERIYGDYPYDGSEREKILFELSSSYLDKWVFDNKYPKSTGYAIFSANGWGTAASITNGYGLPNSSADYEYIYSRGGMHTASAGMEGKPLRNTFEKSVIYDASKDRTITYDVNGSEGVTIEFWLKKDAFDITKTEKEVIVDLWNGNAVGAADYGRLTLILTSSTTAGANPFRITLQSGSTGVYEGVIGSTSITTGSLANWSHYALSLVSASSGITSRLYQNGNLDDERTLGATGFGDFPGLVNGYIGALQTDAKVGSGAQFAGKLSASLDDFRFWKTRRTSEEIHNNWYRGIGGGTNTDDANVKLGVYYKFNEGITGITTTDSVVLDYSGRIANGSWTGYSSGARSTDSAFTDSGLVSSEIADPIIYSTHPDVISLKTEMQTSGSDWDQENGNMLYNSLPSWMAEEDEASNKNVKYLFQIISNYFDTLHTQITEIPNLKNKKYIQSDEKPLPFADRLLSEKGITVNGLFVDSNILEKFGDRDEEGNIYEKKIVEVKNLIYTNIYNNLEHIFKSKGTERSVRNLIRCFGIDDELIKLNIYTDGGTHYFDNRSKRTSLNTKYINFNDPNYFSSTIYQTSSVINTNTFISGSGAEKLERYSAFTAEADIIVPYKIPAHKTGHFGTSFISSSIFGLHEANPADPDDYGWVSGEKANFQVYLVKESAQSNNAKFVIKNQDGELSLESPKFLEIYDDQRWNIAVSVRPDKYELIGNIASGSAPVTYTLEFYGVTHDYGDIRDEFLLTTSLNYDSGSSFLSNTKRFYAGAHWNGFKGNIIDYSDIQLGSFRYYEDYLDKNIIQQHNLDPSNYGLRDGIYPPTTFGYQLTASVPSSDVLAINWNFDLVTGSNATGRFIVDDFSSGSTDTIYGWIDNIIRREHRGEGFSFGASKTSFVSNENIYAHKKELPEISVVSDNVIIKDDQEKFFIKDEDVSDNFYTLEKSMYQTISEEMLNMFSSIVEFNNLVGNSVDKYRSEYKGLNLLRRMFFERVGETPDLDKYMEYFKWIDTAISRIVEDLFPVSARFSGGVTNVIDSHILERNKYQNKFPITTRYSSTEGSAKGHAELNYNWKFGHAPVVSNDDENCLWQKHRKEREDIADREFIKEATNFNNKTTLPFFHKTDNTRYSGSAYVFRTLSKPYKLSKNLKHVVHGGINYSEDKDRNIIHNFVQRAGETAGGVPLNTFLFGQSTGQGVIEQQQCDDVIDPNKKKKTILKGYVGKYSNNPIAPDGPVDENDAYLFTFGTEKTPINFISGTLDSGFNARVVEHFHSGTILTNIHSDTTDYTNEIPMQGTFTQNWVGGHQHRHVDLNYYDSLRLDDDTGTAPPNGLHNEYTREEAWQIVFSEWAGSDGAIGFVGADYGGPYPDPARKAATYYREERAKRPVNIKNIKTNSDGSPFFSHGNYKENYEIVQSFGKHENNLYLRKNPEQSLYLPTSIGSILPETTHPMSLFGQAPYPSGNVFGTYVNNRQPDANVIGNAGVAGVLHSGSFVVNTRASVADGDKLRISNVDGQVATIEMDPSNNGVAVGSTRILTGSSNAEYFANVTGAIETNNSFFEANYTFNITADAPSAGKAIIQITSSTGDPNLAIAISGFTPAPSPGSSFASPVAVTGGVAGVTESRIFSLDVVNSVITGSTTNTIITSRFSAPGGIEVNSLGYLDVYAREYSVYNNLNYRNYTVRSSGSGEAGTIRMNSQNNYREGLQTLLRRHCGQFGADSQHAEPVPESYVVVPNFHKIQRNGRKRPTDASTVLSPVLKNTRDNAFLTSPIPQSDFQYSWLTSSLGSNYSITSGKQRVYGYAPKDGILSSSVIIEGDSGFVVPAITFPTASEIFGE